MIDGGPFRERPRLLMCPRCGELLDRAFDAVLACLACEGVWISPVTLERAFGTAVWPDARAMWWRSAVPCPECAVDGVTQVMTAAMADGVLIDRCDKHGIWLDRGELGRVLDPTRGGDGLDKLRDQLDAPPAQLDGLLARRKQWRDSLEAKRTAAADELAHREAEQQRAVAEAQARARAERERADAERAREEAARLAEERREAERREREGKLLRLGNARQEVSREVSQLEDGLVIQRERLQRLEAALIHARTRLQALDDEIAKIG